MTIRMLQERYVSNALQPAGAVVNTALELESYLVQQQYAEWVGVPPTVINSPALILTSNGAAHVLDGITQVPRQHIDPEGNGLESSRLQSGAYKNLTASGGVSGSTEQGALIGFYVNSTNSGTLALTDGGPSGTAITGTITPAVGWHALPVEFRKVGGLYATIGGTALDVTFVYRGS
jgi:hypothetical protein